MFLLLEMGKEWRLHFECESPLVKDLGIHVLDINESKLGGNIDDAFDGYSIKRHDHYRNNSGIALHTKDSTVDKCSIYVDLPESSLEFLCLVVNPISTEGRRFSRFPLLDN